MENTKTPHTKEGFRTLIMESIVKHRNAGSVATNISMIRSNQLWFDYPKALSPYSHLRDRVHIFQETISDMEEEGLFLTKRDGHGLCVKVFVSKEQAQEVANQLGIMLKGDFYEQLVEKALTMPAFQCPILAEILQMNLSNFVKLNIRYDTGTQEELEQKTEELFTLFRCVEAAYNNEDDILERNFSIKLGLGSKGFTNKYKARVAKILGAPSHKNANAFLEQYHILQNPVMVSFKGNATIYMKNGDRITAGQYSAAIAMEETYIEQIEKVEATKIITIENLTTFNSFPLDSESLVVCTYGFPCKLVTTFLQKVINDNRIHAIWHFGDLDAFGFQIKKDLDRKLSAAVQRMYMDEQTYTKFKAQAIAMTPAHREEFTAMLHDDYFSASEKALFAQMLEEGLTLEQEGVEV